MKGEKVSIYNPAVQAKHPLNGLKLTNSTELHLMQGPITVFDGGAYAGDAQIEDLPPGTERLISYALDLDTEVAPEGKSQPEQLVSVQARQGHAVTSAASTPRTQQYTVKNSGKKAKKVLIEYPLDANWKLVAPKKPDGKDPRPVSLCRRGRAGQAGQAGSPRGAGRPAAGGDRRTWTTARFSIYLRAKVVSDAVKEALAEVVKRKTETADAAWPAAAARAADRHRSARSRTAFARTWRSSTGTPTSTSAT